MRVLRAPLLVYRSVATALQRSPSQHALTEAENEAGVISNARHTKAYLVATVWHIPGLGRLKRCSKLMFWCCFLSYFLQPMMYNLLADAPMGQSPCCRPRRITHKPLVITVSGKNKADLNMALDECVTMSRAFLHFHALSPSFSWAYKEHQSTRHNSRPPPIRWEIPIKRRSTQ